MNIVIISIDSYNTPMMKNSRTNKETIYPYMNGIYNFDFKNAV